MKKLVRCQFLNLLLCSWLSSWFLHSLHWCCSQLEQLAWPLVVALRWLLLERQAQKLEISKWRIGVENAYLFSVSRALEGLCSLWLGKGKEQALGVQRSSSCCWLLLNSKGKKQTALTQMKSVTCHSQLGDRNWPECSHYLTNRFRSCRLASRLCMELGGFGSFSRRQLNAFYLIPVRSLHSGKCEMKDFSKISKAVNCLGMGCEVWCWGRSYCDWGSGFLTGTSVHTLLSLTVIIHFWGSAFCPLLSAVF